MKPRLRFVDGLWFCGCTASRRFRYMRAPIGFGYTPDAAYKDWQSLNQPNPTSGGTADTN